MIVYLESSVLFRFLFKQSNVLKNWGHWSKVCTSELTRVEGFRTIDRMRLASQINDDEVVKNISDLNIFLDETYVLELNQNVLTQASQAYPTIIKTLDAIHLASAILWQRQSHQDLTFLTHDLQLGRAALAVGMQAKGF